jgi:hypothetical protein
MQFVKLHVKTNKNDRNDAEAIQRVAPNMLRAGETPEQQTVLALHRARAREGAPGRPITARPAERVRHRPSLHRSFVPLVPDILADGDNGLQAQCAPLLRCCSRSLSVGAR